MPSPVYPRAMTRIIPRFALAPVLACSLAACQSGGQGPGNVPGDSGSAEPYAEIAESEELRLIGTEPFWGGHVKGTVLVYETPEKPEGVTATVERFAGRNGISFTGRLEGEAFTLAITPGKCSDGMSDRTYPFHATLQLPSDLRSGCAWSQEHPFTGPAQP